MIRAISCFDRWLSDQLQYLKCTPETRAYVVGVLNSQKVTSDADLSATSLVLAYNDACKRYDFRSYQRIGDWVLFVDVLYPAFFRGFDRTVDDLGRLSYYRCHRILKEQWRVYEELADDFASIVAMARAQLVQVNGNLG